MPLQPPEILAQTKALRKFNEKTIPKILSPEEGADDSIETIKIALHKFVARLNGTKAAAYFAFNFFMRARDALLHEDVDVIDKLIVCAWLGQKYSDLKCAETEAVATLSKRSAEFVTDLELKLLVELDWKLNVVVPMQYLTLLCKGLGYVPPQEVMDRVEKTLEVFEFRFYYLCPCRLAASALVGAWFHTGHDGNVWKHSHTLADTAGMSVESLQKLGTQLANYTPNAESDSVYVSPTERQLHWERAIADVVRAKLDRSSALTVSKKRTRDETHSEDGRRSVIEM